MSGFCCEICKEVFDTKLKLTRHVKKCTEIVELGDYYLLKVTDRDDKNYYLYLLLHESETLYTLDLFLRAIWLECCGHLSSFYRGSYGKHYEELEFDELHMPSEFLLNYGDKINYDYDFGSTTSLTVEVIQEMVGGVDDEPIKLVARNVNPYPREDNSPRAGVCGYEVDKDFARTFEAKYKEYVLDREEIEIYTECMDRDAAFINMLGEVVPGSEDDFEKVYLEKSLELISDLGSWDEAMNYMDGYLERGKIEYQMPVNNKLSLGEALSNLNMDTLIYICKINHFAKYSRRKKAELLIFMEEYIIREFKNMLPSKDETMLLMYERFIDTSFLYEDEVKELTKRMDFYNTCVLKHFIWFGQNEEGYDIYVLPEELRDVLKSIRLNDYRMKAKSNTKVVKYVTGLLKLYGVVKTKDLGSFVSQHLGLKVKARELGELLYSASYYYKRFKFSDDYAKWASLDNAEIMLLERSIYRNLTWKNIAEAEIIRASEDAYFPLSEEFIELKELVRKFGKLEGEAIDLLLARVFELVADFKKPDEVISILMYYLDINSDHDFNTLVDCVERLCSTCGIRLYMGFALDEVAGVLD